MLGVYYAEEGVERFYELEVVDDLRKIVFQHNRADARMNVIACTKSCTSSNHSMEEGK